MAIKTKDRVRVYADASGLPIYFDMPSFCGKKVEITIFDDQGGDVWFYSGSVQEKILWNGENMKELPVISGTYIYTITSEDFITNGRVKIFRK